MNRSPRPLWFRLWARYFPEIKHLSATREQVEILQEAFRARRYGLYLVALFCGYALFIHFIVRPSLGPTWGKIVQVGGVIPVVVLSVTLAKKAIESRLRYLLVERGVPVCLSCGYLLKGLPEPRCSECGRPFDPRTLGKAANPIGECESRPTRSIARSIITITALSFVVCIILGGFGILIGGVTAGLWTHTDISPRIYRWRWTPIMLGVAGALGALLLCLISLLRSWACRSRSI